MTLCPLCGARIRSQRITRRILERSGLYRDWSITEVVGERDFRPHALHCPRRGQLRSIEQEVRP